MKKSLPVFAFVLISVFRLNAGTLSYQALPASDTDAKCGISTASGYTSAVDGGNASGTDRVINGITLYSLKAENDSSTADSCTVNALSGSLSNGAGSSGSIAADGTMKDVLSDMTSNDGAGDNSQQEVVLDPASLESGSTYELRVYICNSGGQNRQVSLSFVGDGQAAVETGFFNEDDATTSGGGFKDPNQVYYISYRYTWDGDSTPGITITQKAGNTPFVLYALTNQLVPGGQAAAQNAGAAGNAAAAAGGGGGAASGGDNTAAAGGDNAGGDEGLSEGLVDQGDDQVGVESDDFYNSDSLNSNGQWVDVEKWGKCWQPTKVSQGWCPYTNGGFQNCDTCGWTFVSDEPWAWATYHYGRWCKVSYGCGWCWVPGRVWAGSWVSWRRGEGEKCSCVGWAPLPPEAGCQWNVGISSWVDSSCNIGPECYTFIDVVNFGRESYSGCGCMYERSRNCSVIIDTFNCTNICHGRGGTYCGGPEFSWCNQQIRQRGGMECKQVHVDRFNDPSKMGGKFSRHDGKTLGLMSPKINGGGKFSGKTAASLKGNQIDHGWNGIKDPKAKTMAENHIKQESKGKDPKNTKATLPTDVAKQREAKHGQGTYTVDYGGKAGAGNKAGGTGNKQHPGQGTKTTGGQANKTTGGQAQTSGVSKVIRDQSSQNGQTGQTKSSSKSGFNQHPGGKSKGTTAGVGANTGGKSTGDQHPGRGTKTSGTGKTGGSNVNQRLGDAYAKTGTGTGKNGAGSMHPGQSLKGKTNQNTAGKNAGNNQGGGRIGTAGNNGKESGGNNQGSTNAGHKNEGQSNATGTGGSSSKTAGTGKQGTSIAGAGTRGGSKGKGQAGTGKSSTQGTASTRPVAKAERVAPNSRRMGKTREPAVQLAPLAKALNPRRIPRLRNRAIRKLKVRLRTRLTSGATCNHIRCSISNSRSISSNTSSSMSSKVVAAEEEKRQSQNQRRRRARRTRF